MKTLGSHDKFNSELIVDLFAGGGGASTGFKAALGRHVDIAINHDREALNVHTANHAQTRHYISSVFEVNPITATQGQPVGALWASPDCKHFSKAKGATPLSQKIRGLAWVVVNWAKAVKPRVIFLENVEEFQTWGPLGENGRPCPERKGETFKEWVGQLQALGYKVEWRELRACDYGAPTIRKRLFLVARRDGLPIVWPVPTHAKPDAMGKVPHGLKPWLTASEFIDWSIPCPSIFARKKPHADATRRRIAKGIVRYVIEAKQLFIVSNTSNGHNATSVSKLIQTGYGERTGQAPRELGLEKPLGTVVGSQKHALVAAFLVKHYTGVVGSSLAEPLGTVTSVDHHSLLTASLIHMGHGEGKEGGKRFSHGVRSITEPLNTITATGSAAGLVTSHLVKFRGDNTGGPVTEPLHTISAQGLHHGEIRTFMSKYDDAFKDESGLIIVTIAGQQWVIVDIGLRMLSPKELYAMQGFPEDYRFESGADGGVLTKKAQIRLCGNSVSPPAAEALVRANFSELAVHQAAA